MILNILSKKNKQTYQQFINILLEVFLEKKFSWTILYKKIDQLNRNDTLKWDTLMWLTGILWYYLLSIKWSYDLEKFHIILLNTLTIPI